MCKIVLDEHDGLPYVHVLQDFVFSISITFPEKYKIFRLTWKLLLTTKLFCKVLVLERTLN